MMILIAVFAPNYFNLLTMVRLLEKTARHYYLKGGHGATPAVKILREGKTAEGFYCKVEINCGEGLSRFLTDYQPQDLVKSWNRRLCRLNYWNTSEDYWYKTLK